MQTNLRGRNFISDMDFTKEEVETVMEIALQLKRDRAMGRPHPVLRDKVMALLFFFTSTRTRSSFEAGMAQLGGHAAFIDSTTTQISYYDGIAIRQCDWGVGNQYISDVASASRVPVLNMQCDIYHPFQILADLLTIIERVGDPRGKTINVSWAYASSYQKPISVPQSLILQMSRFGMNVRLTRPPEYKLMPDIVQQAKDNARQSGGSFEILDDFDAGFKDADIIYPKSWGALLTTDDDEESARIGRQYTDWIADEQRMALADPHAFYMHCLPADRNIEVTDGVIDGPQSVVYDEAENRMQ